MKVQIQAGELFDRGLWLDACGLLGISEWALNEGRIGRDDWLDLTDEQAAQLGLVVPRS